MEAVRNSEPAHVERAIYFLEMDPRCYHSGWAKERLLRALKSAILSEVQAARIRRAMLAVVDQEVREEMSEWCRLAPKLGLDEVIADLQARTNSSDDGIRRRSMWAHGRIRAHQDQVIG